MIDGKKLFKSFDFAFQGVKHAIQSDQNFLVHFSIAILVLVLGLYFNVSRFEMALLLLAILLVIATEMINTAIEKMVDLITREHRLEAKIAKDVSSGMVLITAIGAFLLGLFIFIPYIIFYFK